MLKINGWATQNGGTTGGKGGTTVTVSNENDFLNAIKGTDPKIIYVKGKFEIGYAMVGSNKTIVGLGYDAATIGCIRLEGSKNVIIKNISCSNPGGDGIAAAGATNFFISHCTPNNCADGCIDITKGSDYYTVEWCKFFYDKDLGHNFPNLVGSSDTDPDQGKLKGTFHHNYYWKYCTDRMPRVRFGRQHVYNNFYDPAVDQKVSALITAAIGSEVLAENNHFESGDDAFEIREDGKLAGRGSTYGSKYIGDRGNGNVSTVFIPPYPYSLQDASTLGATVRVTAGVDGDSDLTEDGSTEPPVPPNPGTTLKVSAGDDIIVDMPKDFTSFTVAITGLANGSYTGKVVITGNGQEVQDTMTILVRDTTTPPIPPPSLSPIEEFVLINAGTDRDVAFLLEGNSYSIAEFGPKLNIRANATGAASKVKFVLTGAENKIYTDNTRPFALHGNSGTNYFYGTWNPPPKGQMKLVAIPYDSAGAELPSKEINFTFIA